MKIYYKTLSFRIVVLAVYLFIPIQKAFSQDTLISRLQAMSGIVEVQKLESSNFNGKYLLYVEQPIDHANPTLGTFRQRVVMMNKSFDRPAVIITEGYGGQGALRPGYDNEVARIVDGNIIFVEHRYFLESVPADKNWQYLTAENSARDLHRIRELLGCFYQGKWLATGISKGGQTALIYRAFFPDDVDISIPYVAPLCRAKEDDRHEVFLSRTVGTEEERAILENFQKELLLRKAELQPMFDSLCTARKYTFNTSTPEIYDYSVLEFPFAFWQWGSAFAEIPKAGAPAGVLFDYFMKISSPDYFVKETATTPFFVQAGRELGYYGYNTKPFGSLLSINSSEGYLDRLVIPEGAHFKFDKSLYKKLKKFVAKTKCKMLFIYGEYDPWSAVMIDESENDNVVILVQPKGSHRSRISTLPDEMRNYAVDLLKTWLNE